MKVDVSFFFPSHLIQQSQHRLNKNVIDTLLYKMLSKKIAPEIPLKQAGHRFHTVSQPGHERFDSSVHREGRIRLGILNNPSLLYKYEEGTVKYIHAC